MALIKCPECLKQVSDKAKSCPGCGYPISEDPQAPIESGTANYVKGTLGFLETWEGYSIKDDVVCPHCSKRGCVATKREKAKKGISGGKATGAILTAGCPFLLQDFLEKSG